MLQIVNTRVNRVGGATLKRPRRREKLEVQGRHFGSNVPDLTLVRLTDGAKMLPSGINHLGNMRGG